MKYNLLSLLMFLIISINAAAQEPAKTKSVSGEYQSLNYQFFGGYSLIQHLPDFNNLPGIPDCCPKYNQSSSGKGYYFGAGFELNLPSNFYIGLRAGFQAFDADFVIDELN